MVGQGRTGDYRSFGRGASGSDEGQEVYCFQGRQGLCSPGHRRATACKRVSPSSSSLDEELIPLDLPRSTSTKLSKKLKGWMNISQRRDQSLDRYMEPLSRSKYVNVSCTADI
jgi:hypothetical protein